MNKYQLLIGLILKQEVEDTYVYAEKDYCGIEIKKLIPDSDGCTGYITLRVIEKAKVYINDIQDEDFTKAEAKELDKLIREKKAEKDKFLLEQYWLEFGIY